MRCAPPGPFESTDRFDTSKTKVPAVSDGRYCDGGRDGSWVLSDIDLEPGHNSAY